VEVLTAQLPERCVVDGEIVIASKEGLEFDTLQLRLHPAESRVKKLAKEIPASLSSSICFALEMKVFARRRSASDVRGSRR
jgi:hypothetical protein